MKKLLLIMFLFAGCFSYTSGQTAADSITMKKVFGGYQYFQGDTQLSMNKLGNALKPNEAASKQIKSAQSTNSLAMLVGMAGGFMVGWPLGAALAGGDPNWGMAGVGAALIVVSIPITKSVNRKTKQAVETFNSGLPSSSTSEKTELRLLMTENGAGLILRF